jgi:hypothetical protein
MLNHMGNHMMCKLSKIYCLVSFWLVYNSMFVTFQEIVSWNEIVKGIEILVFKGFDKVYDCVKCMIRKWCGIIITHRK